MRRPRPLDVDDPTVIRIAVVHGQGNELLAEYYLRAAGVAAVWVDAAGHVGAQDVAAIENEPGRIVYCCKRGSHFVLAYRLYEWKKAVDDAIERMSLSGELRELNAAFKAARQTDPSVRYVDYLEARKAAMLEALAREGRG